MIARSWRMLAQKRYFFCALKDQETRARVLDGDDQFDDTQQKKRDYSFFSIVSGITKYMFLGSSALVIYNIWLNNKYKEPQEQTGYQKQANDVAKGIEKYFQGQMDFFTKPVTNKLLPDIPNLPPGYVIPKTLVLNLSGTLIHLDYVFGKGAEIKKRNDFNKFLKKMATLYEVVILTDDDTMVLQNNIQFTQTVCQKLDPTQQIIAGRFGRESHVFEGSRYIKDLKYLNRPLNRIVVIESDPERIAKYPDNAVIISKYDGTQSDNTLTNLQVFLEYLSKPEIRDIRSEIKKYGSDNPQVKFVENLKVREIKIQQNMNSGIMGIFTQKKNPVFDKRQ